MISEARKKEMLQHAEEVFARVEELQELGLICGSIRTPRLRNT